MCIERVKSSPGIQKISVSSYSMLSVKLQRYTPSTAYNSAVAIPGPGHVNTEFYMGSKSDGINL